MRPFAMYWHSKESIEPICPQQRAERSWRGWHAPTKIGRQKGPSLREVRRKQVKPRTTSSGSTYRPLTTAPL